MSEQKECFIIMPITTPEPMIEKYRDGAEHFIHVLECLFIPAIEKAGYKPIPPKAEGSDLIQAEIIKNLETAAIVLCDVSCLNPNVFFELGIRTSLNKPVCIVKDELTESVPFDTSILNHKGYNSALETWEINDEIDIISDHLKASVERSKGENTLWKYFGFKSEAEPYKVEAGTEGKLDYLTMQMDQLQKKMGERPLGPKQTAGLLSGSHIQQVRARRFAEDLKAGWPKDSQVIGTGTVSDGNLLIEYLGTVNADFINSAYRAASLSDIKLKLKNIDL